MSEENKEPATPVKKERTLEDLRNSANRYRESKLARVTKKNEPTEEGKAYIQKLKQSDAVNRDLGIESMLAEIMGVKRPGSVVVPYGIRFIDAKMLFEKIIQQQLSAIGKTYKAEAENYEKIDELIKYFIGEPGKLNPNKGVYLYGAVGRGKTRVMEAIMVMCNTIEKRLEANDRQFTSRKFQLKNAKSIVVELGESKSAQTIKKYYTGPLCIDDMGSEDSFKLWGNDMNVVGDIVVERYQRYQQSGLLTHATSNTLPADWTKKYGERVESRLNEMFNVVVLLGQDKRKD